jgi:hypothetical protein
MVATLFAADLFAGTWRANIAKTTQANATTPVPNPPREALQKIEAVANGRRMVDDAVDAAGQKHHGDWTVKFDGKQYPAKYTIDGKPDPSFEGETVSATRIDDHTLQFTFTRNGKVVSQNRNVISTDGKTRTVTQTGTSADGQQRIRTVVWEKQ